MIFSLAFAIIFSLLFSGCTNESSSFDFLWYEKNPVTAHAFGCVYDTDENCYSYTNCIEAFCQSYKKGIRIFECDIDYTKDEIPVLCHDWNTFCKITNLNYEGGAMNYSEFKNALIYSSFHALSLQEAIDLMLKFPDIYLDIDFGGKSPELAINLIQENFYKYGYSISDRFIIEIYSFSDYEKINSLHHFKNYLFTESLFNSGKDLTDSQRDEIIDFCNKKNIKTVAVYSSYITKNITEKYNKAGIAVIAYGGIANSVEDFGSLKEIGCAGIQSDCVTNKDWWAYVGK